MSAEHFLDGLERELLEAARREQSPARRLRPARWLRPLAAAAAVAALLLVVAVLGRPPEEASVPTASQQVQGSWRAGAVTLHFERDNWFADGEGIEVYGWISSQGDRLVLHPSIDASEQRLPTSSAAERRSCDERAGTYSVRLDGPRLGLRPIQEPCPARADILAGVTWERTP